MQDPMLPYSPIVSWREPSALQQVLHVLLLRFDIIQGRVKRLGNRVF